MTSRRAGWLALLAVTAFGAGCAEEEAPDAAAPAVAREAAPMLTEDHARARSARVGDVAYDLAFELDGEAPEYTGSAGIAFRLSDAGEDLTLDFTGGMVESVTVNGHPVDAAYNGFFLTLPGSRLVEGANAVEVHFSHPYSTDGSGLYRFRDPVDGRDYLYTDFQPYDQNRLFPSFDQPDLKARFTTRATVPAAWQVVSIVAESGVEDDGERRHWTFPESAPVSTYIYALHAGEYERWESAAGEIPLRLFARASVAGQVRPDDWFLFTQQGFDFFETYFDVAYPFGKYDQIVVPHFNAGAMENVGAVTFSERFLTRGTVTRGLRRSLASVILHELAHMWFGNLVTMDWWNGLWLNESFATFMAGKALADATEFTETPLRNYRRSVAAYRADERDTTHPIELPVPDTAAAFANFDTITYSKGGATLAQLEHLVGPASFRDGVSDYLKTNAWGTTTVDDFLGAIAAAAQMDLDQWARDWLHEAGTNDVAVEFACEEGTVASMTVLQTAPDAWPTLRTHRTQLGLHRFSEGGGVVTDTVSLTYSGERTDVPDAVGMACPDLVYANHGNWDYARVRFDRATLAVVDANLERFDDPLMRSMLWHGVQAMVADAQLSPVEMIRFALAHADKETDNLIFRQVVDAAGDALGYLVRLSEDGSAGETGERLEAWLWQAFETAPPGSDRQTLLFDSYMGAVTSEGGIARLAALFDLPAPSESRSLPQGFDFDQDRRWRVLAKIAGFDHPATDALLEAETARDPTDQGRLSALAVTSARPDREAQRRHAESLLDPESGLSVAEARAIGGGLFPSPQKAMQLELAADVLARLPELSAGMDSAYFGAVTYGLLGAICDAGYLAMLDDAVAGAADLHPSLRKALLDQRLEVRRCLAIGAAAGT